VTVYVRCVDHSVTAPASRISSLDIELTERCNSDCVHCCINLPADDAEARAREMTTEQVEAILQQAADLGCLWVRLTGGEPLLRPDFERLYLFARRLGMKVLVFTNARLISRHLAELLAQIPPLMPMEVTVYGMHRASYEAVSRVPGSFAQFRRGVELLLKHEVPFILKGALLPPNRLEMEELEAWTATVPWMTGATTYAMFFDLRNRRDDVEKSRVIASLRVSPEEGLAVLTRDPDRFREHTNAFAARFLGPPGDVLFRCGAGRGMSIDAYGRAQPCMGVRAPELTVDVLASSVSEALDRFAGLRELRATNPEYLRRCARCVLMGFCEQCPAKSWAEHGTLDTPVEYLCEVAHTQARWLGWLCDGEVGWDTL
jgi:radical SAM protein with 4Fe4S-binding SPASM domain